MNYLYSIHALSVSLPFICHDLDPAPEGSTVDVLVSEEAVPHALSDAARRSNGYEMNRDAFLMRGSPRSARFLVEHGTSIRFERGPEYDETLFLHLLLFPVMAALLRQRGRLVLHASAALSPAGVLVIAGESGAGKSTTVAALTRGRWTLQSEDVTSLYLSNDGSLQVPPGASSLHLFPESAKALHFDTEGLVPREWHRMKLAIPGAVKPVRRPEAVRRIILLRAVDEGRLQIERLAGRAKLAVLAAAYGPLLPTDAAAVAPYLGPLLNDVEIFSISRPVGCWTLDAVLEAITADLDFAVFS